MPPTTAIYPLLSTFPPESGYRGNVGGEIENSTGKGMEGKSHPAKGRMESRPGLHTAPASGRVFWESQSAWTKYSTV